MSKLILLSIVIVSVVVPMMLASRKAPKRALRTSQIVTTLFIIVWACMCLYWYPRIVPID